MRSLYYAQHNIDSFTFSVRKKNRSSLVAELVNMLAIIETRFPSKYQCLNQGMNKKWKWKIIQFQPGTNKMSSY